MREKRMTWQELIAYAYNSPLLNASAAQRTEILQVKPHYNPFTIYWDSQRIKEMLEKENLSEDAINLLSSIQPLSGSFLYNGFIDYILEEYPVNLSFVYEIIGGAAMLPLAFYKSLTSTTQVNEYKGISKENLGSITWMGGNWVTGIRKSNENKNVTITYENKMSSSPLNKDFDYVVCAIPFSTLRNVEIDPLFSPIKMQAIKEVYYGDFQKSLLLCNQRFWETGDSANQIIGGISYTDLPITMIVYPSDHAQYNSNNSFCAQDKASKEFSFQQPGVLTLYNFNLDSTRTGNLPDDLHFEELKREIEKVHGYPKGYLNKYAADQKTVTWNNEKWFRGGLCFFTPEQKRLFSFAMASPEFNNRVFFAGEHVSANHRWVQGALQSGMEAAHQLVKACYNHSKV
jgi:monoamine oxidase